MATVTLAPMEGVVDVYMRDILTRIGGFDLCVSEFVRVSQHLYPASVFYSLCPELRQDGKTVAGVPVHVQIMGGETHVMAENAGFVAELGAPGVDINFGCPAKTVNRHDAGATLLQWPERLHDIVSAVRRAVPDTIPVSAKMRLGFAEKSLALENALAIAEAGAGKLTIHARTKMEGYRPPAHWEYLRPIAERLDIPVVANGEIWTPEDYDLCREASGCEDIMIGRGVIARPSLGWEIAQRRGESTGMTAFNWSQILGTLAEYHDLIEGMANPPRQAGRLKQWIKLLARSYGEAGELFTRIRRLEDPRSILAEVEVTKERVLDVA
ncbi:tRNA-dihydrouridine synthase family protein [Sneathiella sp. CAU 1612]|uniref:tRNA-dihydrouridine(16) synthase n=2 Tax=Sneathiella sedimenti TaxID=2816034 RepID=A0ABS3F2J5_9PROT|nr:tRNA-dihydrouridine synthase family protein [Sneathiella sedimenti]MBO0332680.1 tRNA-dihydrouridine synthase family protein [Sneathiella sedimenti]